MGHLRETAVVMEYIPYTLEDYLGQSERYLPSIKEIAQIMYELLRALGHLHACGVIHRDLKPSNILVNRTDDGKLILKIIDFSISNTMVDSGVEFLNHLFN